jgi:acetyl-CoA carboxylase beta subunit
MGDRYVLKCPNCGDELYFADFNGYLDQCANCGKYYRMSVTAVEVGEDQFHRMELTRAD